MLSSIQWWTEVAKGKHKDAKFSDRVKASELLGRSQADFVEVRVAPIVTDPHASVESLVERFNTIVRTIKERQAAQAPALEAGRGRARK